MLEKDSIKELAESLLEDKNYYVLEVKVSRSSLREKVVVLLDGMENVDLDTCTKVSRGLADLLDPLTDKPFTLEVSSSGTDYPLTEIRQFHKNIGKDLRVVFLDGQTLEGNLLSVGPNDFVILPKKKKKIQSEPIKIETKDIKEAKVIVSFK